MSGPSLVLTPSLSGGSADGPSEPPLRPCPLAEGLHPQPLVASDHRDEEGGGGTPPLAGSVERDAPLKPAPAAAEGVGNRERVQIPEGTGLPKRSASP